MPDNYYINEIRQTRERIAKECGDDLDRILDRVQKTALDLGFDSDVRGCFDTHCVSNSESSASQADDAVQASFGSGQPLENF